MPIPFFPCEPFSEIVVGVTGNVGAYSIGWARIDSSGGTNFVVSHVSGTTYQFSNGSSKVAGVVTQTWRCTVADTVGSASEDVNISLERYFEGDTPEGPPP